MSRLLKVVMIGVIAAVLVAPVAAQDETAARAHPPDLRLHAIEIARQHDVGVVRRPPGRVQPRHPAAHLGARQHAVDVAASPKVAGIAWASLRREAAMLPFLMPYLVPLAMLSASWYGLPVPQIRREKYVSSK